MRRIALFAILVVFALSACKGCGDTAGTAANSDDETPQACDDRDGDGWDGGLTCEGRVDCDDDDPDTYPDAPELCDGVDNDCDGEVDEDCEECEEEGETRDCGDDTGRCVSGVQTCGESLVWGPCVGAEGPFTEECNGEDDDCDGEVDEGAEVLCDDGFQCNGAEVCQDGACVEGEPTDCSDLDGPCTEGVCSEKDGGCVAAPLENGAACDDGNFCTTNGLCEAGECATEPRDCSEEDDQCNVGVCDEEAGACVKEPVEDGETCDDGEFCTVDDVCTMGVCGGADRDCTGVADQCNTGICDEANDECVPEPVDDDTACDDGLYCNVGESCQGGVCTGGTERSCTAADGSCRTGTCDEASGSCTGDPVDDGTPCDDSEFCTVLDACVDGTCMGGMARDCSSEDGVCKVGVCSEPLNSCISEPADDGDACDDGRFCTTVDSCLAGTCVGGGPEPDCSSVTGDDPCMIGTCDMMTDTCEATFDPTCCDVNVDADLDGYDECVDCNDTDGSVFPGATETCNGVDDDCDGDIDEDFDADSDGFSVCSTEPDLFDCDDQNPDVNPGMDEICDDGAGGQTGNGIDDNCNGYIDEGCNPCTTDDVDGDGFSECDGDCDDDDDTRYPGAPEVCDGLDNDCNAFTTDNCTVSDECNHDGDGDYSNDADVCMANMLCACITNKMGDCLGDYRCTSYCNSSDTGPIGDGCEADQTCNLDLFYSANVHGCSVTTDTPGALRGGADCSSDDECRSLNCDKLCRGAGPICGRKICHDQCTSDGECGSGAVCRIESLPPTILSGGDMDGKCWPPGEVYVGDTAVGDACSADTDCDHGKCVTDPNDGSEYCTESCCTDSDCGAGYGCSLFGDYEEANSVFSLEGASPCSDDGDCAGEGELCGSAGTCAWRFVETVGQCVKDVSNQGTRRAGQACSANSECESSFCESSLGICVEPCCADSSCPTGLSCELQIVATRSDRATQARVCMNTSVGRALQRM